MMINVSTVDVTIPWSDPDGPAGRAGIADAHAGVTPDAKVARVAALQHAGAKVLVAGDGINDAAALAAADVGIAMARGADVTLHAADIVIRSPRLAALADTVELARATLRRIRENLGLALCYNAVAIPLAMTGVLQPLYAAIASSLGYGSSDSTGVQPSPGSKLSMAAATARVSSPRSAS